ncbi:hypothetical protein [Pseudactinotalea sp. Z1748]|uniref:hypothetical protein n=1 Tax=Pseudactinotalea sp. Z1748 TaxID=3413027 RepID=UPI003C7CBD29
MVTTRKRRNTWAAALGALLLTVGLAGCNNEEPNPPEPTDDEPTQTTNPAEDAIEEEPADDPEPPEELSEEDQNIEDARDVLTDYFRVAAEVANDGYETWRERLEPFWGSSPVRQAQESVMLEAQESGQYTEGAVRVVSATATEYTPDTTGGGGEMIRFDVCTDSSDVKVFDGEGNQADQPDQTRAATDVLMHRQGDEEQRWTIREFTPLAETC